jgi:hypothetical protein
VLQQQLSDDCNGRRKDHIMPINTGVCQVWPTDFRCHDIPDTIPEDQRTGFIRAASDYLWAMTGRRLGASCPIVVRPCRKSCVDDALASRWILLNHGVARTGGWVPYISGGEFRNASICGCRTTCHCGDEICEVELVGPVYDIQTVDIGGHVLTDEQYRLYDGRFLARVTDGTADPAVNRCWPACQDLSREAGRPDTFSITYRTGVPVPQLGVLAVSSLAAHFMRGCGGGCGCGVGTRQNLQRLSRQGVELEFADAQQVFSDGRTGIEIVDQFIRAFNPHGLASPMRVLSPDAPRYPRLETIINQQDL